VLNAQHAYRPLVVDGKDWVSVYLRATETFHFENGELVGSDRTEDYGEMHEVLQGDTVIDGLSYKKVQTTTPYSSYSDFALREEDRKVYAYVFYFKKEFLLYDFNAEVGDVVMAGWVQGRRYGLIPRASIHRSLISHQSQAPTTTSMAAGSKVFRRKGCISRTAGKWW